MKTGVLLGFAMKIRNEELENETKRKELFVFKANKCSPIPALVSMYETYGTICDRDFVIQRNGSGTETNYSVVPMDKKRFKLDENAYSKKKVLKMLLEAFPKLAPILDLPNYLNYYVLCIYLIIND